MNILDRIRQFISKMSFAEFRLYSIVFLSCVVVLVIGVDIQVYRKSRALLKQIKRLNDEREEEVRTVLQKGAFIKRQQEEMNRLLSEDLDFKIAGYTDTVLKKLGLSGKKIMDAATQSDIDQTYRESSLQMRLEDMNMRDLTKLLQAFENNKRISIKQLEITKSSKRPNTIEVQITISTMLLKTFSES
jgi:hypothetical protein